MNTKQSQCDVYAIPFPAVPGVSCICKAVSCHVCSRVRPACLFLKHIWCIQFTAKWMVPNYFNREPINKCNVRNSKHQLYSWKNNVWKLSVSKNFTISFGQENCKFSNCFSKTFTFNKFLDVPLIETPLQMKDIA